MYHREVAEAKFWLPIRRTLTGVSKAIAARMAPSMVVMRSKIRSRTTRQISLLSQQSRSVAGIRRRAERGIQEVWTRVR